MSTNQDLEKLTISIEKQINALLQAKRDGKISDDDLASVWPSLESSILNLSTIKKEVDKIIKATLELNDECQYGNRIYYYKPIESRVFDSNKAKKKLEELEYSVDDFYTIRISNRLKFDIK